LPLRGERTGVEQAIETEASLAHLSAMLGVDALRRTRGSRKPSQFSTAVISATRALARGRGTSGSAAVARKKWEELGELLYKWDAAIQDTLAAHSETQVSAYQLGRGLAEASWALAPEAKETEPGSWNVLLGDDRARLLTRLLGRLAGYFDPLTAPAIAGSLKVWTAIAKDPNWRGASDAPERIHAQTLGWYGLLVLGEDPSSLVRPTELFTHARTTLKIARVFAVELLIGLVAFAAVTGLAYLLSSDTGSALGKTILGAVGVAGISVASVRASLRNRAQALLARWRTNAYADLVAGAITTAPTAPQRGVVPRGEERRTGLAVRTVVQERTLGVALGDASPGMAHAA
jgi:hypothetical protein